MRLHPNPPRLVSVALALGLAVIGVAFALPVDAAMPLLEPIVEPVAGAIGLALDVELGYLCLFLSAGLLVAGSLLPGI